MSFGENLKKQRVKMGLTQDQLAEFLGVSRQAVSSWERDEQSPEISKLLNISAQLHISLDRLFSDELDSLNQQIDTKTAYTEEIKDLMLGIINTREGVERHKATSIRAENVMNEMVARYANDYIDNNGMKTDILGDKFELKKAGVYLVTGCISMGKTSAVLNIVMQLLNNKKCVYYFTLNGNANNVLSRCITINSELWGGGSNGLYRLRRNSFVNIIGMDFDTLDADIINNNLEA